MSKVKQISLLKRKFPWGSQTKIYPDPYTAHMEKKLTPNKQVSMLSQKEYTSQ